MPPHSKAGDVLKYIYFLCPMKYIAQSVPIFTSADLIEYPCFSDVLLFP